MSSFREIKLQPIPSQQLNVSLGTQKCTIKIYQRDDNVYCDVQVNKDTVFSGALCSLRQNIVPIFASSFIGQLMFLDLQGSEEPDFSGFGDRWRLYYVI